ncbi:MAG: FKBP-type peptidyl-prolyl cis-trans isomerase [Candidatus Kaiserbacteria bacterium]|nr:FKBP-type peptidyl-prolyl cis-trans isomerase [Candidatus Kaiserbacteria bacterium]
MNKTVIWIVGILVVLVGGFLIYKSMSNNSAANTQATTTPQSGTASTTQVQAQEVSVGTGTQAQPGDEVSVLYVGQLQDGTTFDSSAAHGNTPYTFVLGSTAQGSPIPGFQIGVNGMKEGGERIMAIPPSLGYGANEVKDANGKVVIPANSTIIFDVKLVKVAATTTKK